jgi:cytosine/adenosine deaminase-related metal-dependent hydrolase
MENADGRSSLLLKNIQTIVSCDENDTIYRNADIHIVGNRIAEIGPSLREGASRILDCSRMLCYPGLVNTHHHLYQQFSRNLPFVQNLELFDWLKALYRIWQNIDAEVAYASSLTGLGELMKNGCTTCFDHHYVFPARAGDLIEAEFRAADALGIRLYASRGSMDLSQKDGGLPPDTVVQPIDEILRDSVRLAERWNDTSFGSMRNLALAPCSPFSVSTELLRQSALLARQYGLRLHTHLGETKDEEDYTLTRWHKRPLEYMADLGWLGNDVWFAHGIHLNDDELAELARTGTGIAHCPVSNMKLSSGVARIPKMLKLGIPVGLGVDGSASQDGSSLLEELRICYLLHRLVSSNDAPSGYECLKLATRGGASLLGRTDIGELSAGKCADLFLIDSRKSELTGAAYDPANMLATVGFRQPVDYTIVNGVITVEHGRLARMEEEHLADYASGVCDRYLQDQF